MKIQVLLGSLLMATTSFSAGNPGHISPQVAESSAVSPEEIMSDIDYIDELTIDVETWRGTPNDLNASQVYSRLQDKRYGLARNRSNLSQLKELARVCKVWLPVEDNESCDHILRAFEYFIKSILKIEIAEDTSPIDGTNCWDNEQLIYRGVARNWWKQVSVGENEQAVIELARELIDREIGAGKGLPNETARKKPKSAEEITKMRNALLQCGVMLELCEEALSKPIEENWKQGMCRMILYEIANRGTLDREYLIIIGRQARMITDDQKYDEVTDPIFLKVFMEEFLDTLLAFMGKSLLVVGQADAVHNNFYMDCHWESQEWIKQILDRGVQHISTNQEILNLFCESMSMLLHPEQITAPIKKQIKDNLEKALMIMREKIKEYNSYTDEIRQKGGVYGITSVFPWQNLKSNEKE